MFCKNFSFRSLPQDLISVAASCDTNVITVAFNKAPPRFFVNLNSVVPIIIPPFLFDFFYYLYQKKEGSLKMNTDKKP